jgi:hypothetical protein
VSAAGHNWRAKFHRGQRVQFVGMFGNADGPVGTVQGVSSAGLRVRWVDRDRVRSCTPRTSGR